jgi:L-iditol 2-dehydrogenase
MVQLARVAGAAVVVGVEPIAHRRAAALAMGADAVCDPAEAAARIGEITRGSGADVVLEVAGTDDAVGLAVDVVRPGRRVVLAGIPSADTTTFPASTARRKGISLVMVRRMREMYPRTIALVDSGKVDVRSIVSHTFGLADVAAAFALGESRVGLKVIVEPNA